MAQSNETFNVTIGANMDVSGVLGAVKQMQGAFNGLKLPQSISADMIKDFNKLQEALKKFDTIAKQDHFSKADIKSLQKLQKEIDSTFNSLEGSFNDLSGQKLYLEADYTKIKEARQVVDELKADIQSKLSSIKIDFSSAKGGTASLGLDTLLNRMEQGVKTSKTLSAAMSEIGGSIRMGNLSTAGEQFTQMITKAKGLKGASSELLDTFKQWGLIDFSGQAKNINSMAEKSRLLSQAFEKLIPIFAQDSAGVGDLSKKVKDAVDEVLRLEKTGAENFNNSISTGAGKVGELGNAMKQTGQSTIEMADGMRRASDEIKQLQQSTQYFFSLRNMMNLLKRGVREAVDTVKELDKVMTETAVVTDFDVGDMWKRLPEYTANANALGASVQDMYEATTLYYQQGLDTDQAMGIAAETMKMARIGGLEAADATDKMTAALRGFNMELNEASAQRVNDVYSNLAAKTASDTEELGTAMQRTASIAASAGMSFEGTAAFLAQAIETTREPAENLGTAMKTIVARFTELKKNPLEITEIDGEEVSYNKIDTALQSIGVSLKDTNGQFRDLDQVFLDISQRWDSLTQTQQRYIATTAAGSRQQSRFIAMMSNYERTVQLMDYANNSSGASAEQFGKTMESLEAKLNKFENAWKKFLMGIMNDSWTKGIVDGATTVLNTITKLIDVLSFNGQAKGIKSALSLFTAFTALKGAGRIANRLIGGLGGLVDPTSSFGQGFKQAGFKQGRNEVQAKAISQPIVNSLSKISGQIAAIAAKQGVNTPGQQGINTAGNKITSKEDYQQARKAFSGLAEADEFEMKDASKIFSGLDEKHQLSLFNNSPGTKKAMQKASLNWFNSKGLSEELTVTGREYINAIYKGMSQGAIPVDKGIELIGRPDLWGEYFATDAAQAFSNEYLNNLIPNEFDLRNAADEMIQKFTSEELAAMSKEEYSQHADKLAQTFAAKRQGEGLGDVKGKVSDLGKLANGIGAVGDKFTQAGYGISAFGSLLAQLGGPIGAVGSGLQGLGGIISSLGMSISGITSIVTLFTDGIVTAGGATLVAGSTIAAVVAPLAAFGAALFIAYKHFQNIKKAGEEVTKTFNETGKTAEDNIIKLKSYQTELATLSKGVDSNGNNVNLDDSEYQRYLEIVDSIAEINPDIVQGYNAQGHAIINNNTALEETLRKLEGIKKEAYDAYTKEESLQKLIDARNINKDYKQIKITGQEVGAYMGYGHGNEGRAETGGIGKQVPLAGDVASLADKIGLLKGFNETSLQKYGIESLEALKTGEEQAVKQFIKHRKQIEAELNNNADIEVTDAVTESFEKLGENAAAFDEAIKPVYDNLLTAVSNSPLYDSVANEFKDALQIGLKDLASQDLSAKEMSKQANTMLARFANLTEGSGKYADALKIVEEAQDKFASTLDETEYKADVQPAINDLMRLKEEALSEGSAYGDALAEYLENQIERISRFTEEGAENLTSALNTATDEISAAEEALDNFNNATKTDYATAAEGMKSIYDKTTETFKDSYGTEIQKHAEGKGDQTFWTGAEAMLGDEAIDKLVDNAEDGYEAAEKVSSAIGDLEPMLREGQEGFEAFEDRVLANADALSKIEGVTWDEDGLLTNIPEDKWHEVAEALGVSDELLTSMLNKGRQFADISFMNVEEARKALAASDYTIKGTGTTNGEKNLYVKEDTMRAELSAAGYVQKGQQDEQIAKLLEQGVKTIPSADEMTTSELQGMADDWGVKTLPDLISTLNDTGNFTKDEIQAYADKLGMLGDEDRFDSLYSDIIEAAQNPELAKQTGVLETISAQVGALIDNRTGSEAKSDYKEAHKALVGGEGVDTEAQAFAYGKKLNEDGSLGGYLNAGEYEETKKSLEGIAQSYKENAAIAAEHVKTTTGKEKERWEQVQKGYEDDAARVEKYLQMGAEAYKKYSDELDKEAEAKKSKDKNREGEQKKQQEEKDKQKVENEGQKKERQGQEEAKKYNKPLTEAEGRKGQEEARKYEHGQEYDAETKARDKGRQQERELNDLRQKELTGRKAEIEGRQQALQTERQLQRQKELEARNIGREQELDIAKNLERERVGREKEISGRDEAKQATLQTNIDNAQSQIDFLVGKNINASLQHALTNLDASTIASDPAQTQALSNVYKNLINDRLPKAEDLQDLDIYNQLDSGYQSQIEEASKSLGEKVKAGYEAWDEANGNIPNVAFVGGAGLNDPITKSITSLGQKVKNWWDKINGLKVPQESSASIPTPSSSPTIQHDQEAGVKRTAQFKPEVDDSELNEAEEKTNSLIDVLNQGATFDIKVGGDDLTKQAQAAQKINQAQGDKNFNLTGNVSGTDDINAFNKSAKKAEGLQSHAVKYTAKVSGTPDVVAAVSAGKDFEQRSNHTVTYTTVYKQIGSPSKKEATGAHNHGYAPAPSFGSAAKGYGQVGPKGKGGLTLTGELGYEIAWIPSENRSMILGANGPQMVNLPGDTVVWTHEQSKKILSQKSIPAGSHSGPSESATPRSTKRKYITVASTDTNTGTGSGGGKDNGGGQGSGQTQEAAENLTDASKMIQKAVVWWENIARRTETIQRKADDNQKAYEKYVKKASATLKGAGKKKDGQGDAYIDNLNKNIKLFNKEVKRANGDLKRIDYGTKAQKKAAKTKGNKDNQKANKKAYLNDRGGAVKVSYKSGDETKEKLVKTSSYVKKKDGTYVINQKKLNKIKNKDERKATADALNKEIDDRISKRNKAQDDIAKAKEELEKFSQELYETFFAWESELTKIWNITQKIQESQSKTSRVEGYLNLMEAQLSSGLAKATDVFNKETIKAYKIQLKTQVDTIKAQAKAIEVNKEAVKNAYNVTDEKETLQSVKNKLNQDDKVDKTKKKRDNAKAKLDAAKADKKKQQNEIKKQRAILKKKDLKPAEEKAAKKALNKAQSKLKKDETSITTYKNQYDATNKKYKKIKGKGLNETERIGYEEYAKELKNNIKVAEQAQKYMKPTTYADGTMSVDFDTEAFEADKLAGLITKDMAEGIDKYVTGITDTVENLNKAYEDLTSGLTQLYQSLADLKEEYVRNAEELVSNLDEKDKKEADRLKKLSDSLTKALKDLLEEVKRKLDERRKQEDNAKTEKDISQKQQRLAALRADTSGGHAVEIAQLEKEIAEAQQNYQRSLEDQLLDKLQQQADEAAKQRERQIEIQEAIHEAVNNVALVDMWLMELQTLGNSEADNKRREQIKSEMRDAYRSANDYDNQLSGRKDIIDKEFESLFSNLDTYDEKRKTLEDAITSTKDELGKVKASLDALNETMGGKKPKEETPKNEDKDKAKKDAEAKLKKAYDTWLKSRDVNSRRTLNDSITEAKKYGVDTSSYDPARKEREEKEEQLRKEKEREQRNKTIFYEAVSQAASNKKIGADEFKTVIGYANIAKISLKNAAKALADTKGLTWVQVLKAAKKAGYKKSDFANASTGDTFKKAYDKWNSYSTGGLADYTGPAWLDGTPSKPELVLNAQDTKNFIALKDVLSRAMGSINSTDTTTYGDMTYEININVEKLTSDYDVDKVAERVKKIIVKDSSYRNVTQVRNLR